MAELRRVCVFCGSSPGVRSDYQEAARRFGQLLAARDIGLVYGGGRLGLMGTIADAVLEAGGEVVGIIPAAMVDREVAHHGISELITVEDMFERKGRMMEVADAFVSLPGGIGTLDEMFEVLTWNQLGYLAKPTGLLDVAGYWRELEALLDATVRAGFMGQRHRDLLLREADPDALLDRLQGWSPPGRDKLVQ